MRQIRILSTNEAGVILLIDNYDSFVHTLARYVGETGRERRVVRNDRITIAEIEELAPEAIIISPGPCTPYEAGQSINIVRRLGSHFPILGVCLGHQCIAVAFGGEVVRARMPVHGKQGLIRHCGEGLFLGLSNPLPAGRYHSLTVRLPPNGPLRLTAHSEDGEIMALEHRSWPLWGVQFHPESILSEGGHRLLENFFTLGRERRSVLEPS
jgi:anthranilate synthase/aminodeoxychorismate synthase-like glutamine amidotransferase